MPRQAAPVELSFFSRTIGFRAQPISPFDKVVTWNGTRRRGTATALHQRVSERPMACAGAQSQGACAIRCSKACRPSAPQTSRRIAAGETRAEWAADSPPCWT
jgi:hypothetical protein